ncbi:hypothetical protein [Gluconobacter japonicus]|uniref:Uncharacterized protein n=1 Tax=Gluconobacter japonicus TaxID=376620 RepID=A0A9Q2IUW9_GLUJA|nr:hypothetical protein [Gluconobacter japonicus]MBF0871784.1 hypothetical protein [Gluconobacter japonicus]
MGAYRIASTQKIIASNKYNLDLFDRRYSAFIEYESVLLTINTLGSPAHAKASAYDKIIESAKKCEFLFPKIEKLGFLRTRNLGSLTQLIESHKRFVFFEKESQKTMGELIGAKNNLQAKKIRLSTGKYEDEDELRSLIRKQINLIKTLEFNNKNTNKCFIEFQESTYLLSKKSAEYMKKFLQVPQSPY